MIKLKHALHIAFFFITWVCLIGFLYIDHKIKADTALIGIMLATIDASINLGFYSKNLPK